MKKSIILLSIVLIASCPTTGLNFFDTVDKLTISEYQGLNHRQQLLVCGGFLIGGCQYNGRAFVVPPVSANELHSQIERIIKEYNPNDNMILSLFNISLYSLMQSKPKNG